jgi:acetylornithine/succinyldiaminopimelate/putrescine aminotransferase
MTTTSQPSQLSRPGANLNDQLLARLKATECPDSTAPAHDPSLVFARARGSLIYDVEGREYVDLCAGFGALALGHNPLEHAALFAAHAPAEAGVTTPQVIPPIVHGMGDVYASKAKVELLDTLMRMLPPSFAMATLALTGSHAVETALKTAMLATKRTGFIAFGGGYHGVDLGVLPLTARPDFSAPFGSFLAADRVERLPYGAGEVDVVAAAKRLQDRGAGLAGIVVEPVQGRAGVRLAPEGWLATLRACCDRLDALLVYDEVFTGLGRTGRLTFADLVPCDLLCLGKALGGGFPVSACVGTRKAMTAWPVSTGEALHTGTFFGHPFSCEIAAATLRAVVDQKLVERSGDVGARALRRLRESVVGKRHVVEVRGVGLMLAVELCESGAGAALMDKLRSRGVIALASGERGESLSVTPALNIPEALLESALDRIVEALS